MLHVARRDIEKFQERSADHHSVTYIIRFVVVEGRIIDDKGSTINEDCSSVLKVVCGPPGHRRNFRKFLQTITHPLTSALAALLSKVLV
jgi:hypothetical protein